LPIIHPPEDDVGDVGEAANAAERSPALEATVEKLYIASKHLLCTDTD
jgi:hypothetical protein